MVPMGAQPRPPLKEKKCKPPLPRGTTDLVEPNSVFFHEFPSQFSTPDRFVKRKRWVVVFKKCIIAFLFQAWHWTSSVLSISKTWADMRSIQPYIFNLPHHPCSWSNILNLFLFLENYLTSSLAPVQYLKPIPSSLKPF